MFLKLNHQRLDIYPIALELILACYKVTKYFPTEEKYGMTSQIRKASLSVHLNLSEGASRKSLAERKRFYEISRGSLCEIDATLDAAQKLNYLENIDMKDLGYYMIKSFKILTGLINAQSE